MKTFAVGFFIIAIFLVNCSAEAPNTAKDLSMLLQCVRSSEHDMLGNEFATGDQVHVKYIFNQKGARKGEKILYLAVITKDGKFGRLFQLVNTNNQWSVTNDANFQTASQWKLTSDPLGGIFSTSLMTQALAELEKKPSDAIVQISKKGRQPEACTTYLQK